MTARFRIRTPGGQEVSFATKEMFENFVRSGDLSPDDLVYDRDTGSWSSARTHPAVIEIQYEMEPAAGREPGTAQPQAPKAGSAKPPSDQAIPERERPPAQKASTGEEAPSQEATPAGQESPAQDAAGGAPSGTPKERDATPVSAEALDGGDADAEASAEESPAAGSEAELDFDLELTEVMSPEESKRIFLEQLKAERQADIDAGDSVRDSLSGFTIDSESMGQGLEDRPPASAAQRRPRSGSRRRDPSTGRATSGRGGSRRTRTQSGGSAAHPGKKPSKGGGLGRVLRLLIVLGLLAAGGYAAYEIFLTGSESGDDEGGPGTAEAAEVDALPVAGEPSPDEGAVGGAEPEPRAEGESAGGEVGPRPADAEPADLEPDPVEDGAGPGASAADTTEAEAAPSAPDPVIPATESAIRGRAHERYLAEMRRMLRDLEPIPEVWPTGPYLSVPSDYPEVVDTWQGYLSTIEAVRPGDEERYRLAYEAALDDAAVTGDERQERLEAGLAGFAETDSLRRAHFDRVDGLARAALRSHNALVEAEGTILYDPTGSTGRQEGVGRGTSARDAESRLVLDQVIELLEAALDADGKGPGSAENVREWVWDGFLDAATR